MDDKCGVSELDGEHRELLTLHNDLVHALLGRASLDLERAFLDTVHHSAALHFRTEGRLIRRTAYARAGEHLADHRRFLAGVLRLRAQATDGPSLCDAALMLRCWLVEHFQEDRDLLDWLRRQARDCL
ncbi:hypothetical protein DEW08_06650 [Azospirillum thermophilum]|uniref:Hemerythrin-like domain-containing protein n=1 Tax=Azospirillum thermophilum TaxID=2202148 RepID=A0A2S2CNG1_9PROT|nr:hypothetical protein DEW08_06650 [Azospirillum thermophilum]